MVKPPVVVLTSHVAKGGVGGRAAVFALERLGFPVVSVPTVALPWHPGAGPGERIVPPPASFDRLVDDLAEAGWLSTVGGMLTGYFGGAAQVAAATRLVTALKAANPKAIYLCDPVLGDGDALYVSADIAAAVRDRLLPLADIATPNRFELGWLTETVETDNAGLADAARKIGPHEVVVTSAFARAGEAGAMTVTRDAAHLATHAAVTNAPHGTGDLAAALYLAHRLDGRAMQDALGRSLSSVAQLAAHAAGTADLPLASGQEALVSPRAPVTVAPL